MKFLSVAAFATLAAAVVEAAVTLTVTDSTNESLNGLGLSSIHEGAGINYFLLGSGAEDLEYVDGKLQAQVGNYPYFFNYDSNIVQLSVVDSPTVTITDGKLDLGQQVYACKNINDPYNYSQRSFAVTIGELGDECYPISIKVNGLDDSASSSTSTSEAASSTAVTSTEVPSSSVNGTTEEPSTETTTVASTLTETTCTECTKATETPSINTLTSIGAGAKNVAGVAAAGMAVVAMLL